MDKNKKSDIFMEKMIHLLLLKMHFKNDENVTDLIAEIETDFQFTKKSISDVRIFLSATMKNVPNWSVLSSPFTQKKERKFEEPSYIQNTLYSMDQYCAKFQRVFYNID